MMPGDSAGVLHRDGAEASCSPYSAGRNHSYLGDQHGQGMGLLLLEMILAGHSLSDETVLALQLLLEVVEGEEMILVEHSLFDEIELALELWLLEAMEEEEMVLVEHSLFDETVLV